MRGERLSEREKTQEKRSHTGLSEDIKHKNRFPGGSYKFPLVDSVVEEETGKEKTRGGEENPRVGERGERERKCRRGSEWEE